MDKKPSEIITKSNAVNDNLIIRHNIGSDRSLRITEMDKSGKENVLLEIKAGTNEYVRIEADISTRKLTGV